MPFLYLNTLEFAERLECKYGRTNFVIVWHLYYKCKHKRLGKAQVVLQLLRLRVVLAPPQEVLIFKKSTKIYQKFVMRTDFISSCGQFD